MCRASVKRKASNAVTLGSPGPIYLMGQVGKGRGGGAWGKRELQVWVHQAYELMLRRGRRLGLHQQWQLVTFQRLHGLALV